ncbi:hypothetical protein BDR04DRAFT_1122831 [Suillus decipiens]|nr:hypothetical protein BDR04DRAFT_1122831 [Suillus decipiens]
MSPLDLFTPNFINTTENLTTGPQIQVPPLDSLIPNFATTAENLTTGPHIQAPFVSTSDMPLILPPPPTRPQTPHATDVCLPVVPDEVPVVSEDTQQLPPPEETHQQQARNVTFNRHELDNAIDASSGRPHVTPIHSAKQKESDLRDASEGKSSTLNDYNLS